MLPILKKLVSKYYRRQLSYNHSASQINDGIYSVASNTKFHYKVAIRFSTDIIMEPHMPLMKEMADLFLIGI